MFPPKSFHKKHFFACCHEAVLITVSRIHKKKLFSRGIFYKVTKSLPRKKVDLYLEYNGLRFLLFFVD